MLPFAKRSARPIPSDSELVITGEIEVVDDRYDDSLVRSTRPHMVRQALRTHALRVEPEAEPVTYPVAPSRGVSARPPSPPDSSTRIAVSRRPQTIVPPATVPTPPPSVRDPAPFRDPEPSVSDEDMTRLLSYRPRFVPPPSQRPAPWSMSPAVTLEAGPRAEIQPATVPPPPSSRSLHSAASPARASARAPAARSMAHPMAATAPSPRPPDSLRPVELHANAADASGRHSAPPTSITMQTAAITGRPTAMWAAALVALGVFVGVGSAFYAKGGDASVASATASILGSHAAASQPPADSFTPPPPAPAPQPVAVAPPTKPAEPAVSEKPVEKVAEKVADKPSNPTSDPVAALTSSSHGESSHSRPTYVAPGSAYSSHRSSASRSAAAAPVAATPAPAPVLAAAGPSLGASAPDPAPLAAAAAPAPAPKASKGRSKKGSSDDDLQAASASDALARAQLEAALR